MVVNLSPTEESHQETVCSLRFAAQVNKCELGKSKKTVEDLDEEGAAGANTTPTKGAARGRPGPAAAGLRGGKRSRSSPTKLGQHKK